MGVGHPEFSQDSHLTIMSKSFLRGQDMARIVGGYEIESTTDFIFSGLAAFLLQIKLMDWDMSVYPADLGAIRPDPITRSTRMLLYRAEAEKWRLKHPIGYRKLTELFKSRDFNQMVEEFYNGFNLLSSIVSFVK